MIPELYPDLTAKFPNFIKEIKVIYKFDENDVIVIGSGETKQQAMQGAWAAGYTLID